MSRLGTVAGRLLCAAVLSLAALAGGCVRGTSAPNGGGAAAPPQALLAAPTQSPNPPPAPAPSPRVESPLPRPTGFVNDFANVIDARTEEMLEAKFERLKAAARIEFAVATVETTGAQDIFDYSRAVARGWGVGPPEGQDGGGLLLLLAVKDRKWRLQVSDRLRADLPDDETAEMAKVMTPSLRAGRYGEAVTKYADALIQRLAERRGFSTEGGELPPRTSPEEKPKPSPRREP